VSIVSTKVLELFAGSRSIGKAAQELGYDVFSSDINSFDDIDYVVDILEFDVSKVPFVPDFIWHHRLVRATPLLLLVIIEKTVERYQSLLRRVMI